MIEKVAVKIENETPYTLSSIFALFECNNVLDFLNVCERYDGMPYMETSLDAIKFVYFRIRVHEDNFVRTINIVEVY